MNEAIFFFNNAIVSGLVIGSVYALGAIGVSLIFGILRFAHFAHGDMMTMGAFATFIVSLLISGLGLSTSVPIAYFALPIAVALTAAAALSFDKMFYAPLRNRGAKPVTLLVASIGVTMIIQGLIRLFFGTGSHTFYEETSKTIFQIRLPIEGVRRAITFTEPQVVIVVLTILVVVALRLFLTRSRFGKAMRAASDNSDLAEASGINIKQVVRITWMIAGGLACLAGTMLALDVTLKPDLAFNIVLPIFAAAIVGGLGHPYGAIIGGYLIGFAESLAVFNWGIFLRPYRDQLPDWVPANISIVPTEYKLTVAFVILIVALLVRPTGILRGSTT